MTRQSPEHPLVVRPARAEDREAILSFSRQTWDWGDYLEYVWDEWLASPEGQMLVGEIDGRPVAVGRARIVGPGEGWLEGLRVDPSVRRSGVGGAMTDATLGAARELGAEVVRFATRSDTYPVHRIAERLGFVKVASYSVVSAEALADGGAAAVPLGPQSEESAWALLSTVLPSLTWRSWHLRVLNQDELLQRIGTEEAFAPSDERGLPDTSAVAFAVEDADDGQLVVDMVASREAEALARLGLALRRLAAEQGLERVEARVSEEAPLASALASAGYSPMGEVPIPFWIFEWRATAAG